MGLLCLRRTPALTTFRRFKSEGFKLSGQHPLYAAGHQGDPAAGFTVTKVEASAVLEMGATTISSTSSQRS